MITLPHIIQKIHLNCEFVMEAKDSIEEHNDKCKQIAKIIFYKEELSKMRLIYQKIFGSYKKPERMTVAENEEYYIIDINHVLTIWKKRDLSPPHNAGPQGYSKQEFPYQNRNFI